jgi:hypothetical protein
MRLRLKRIISRLPRDKCEVNETLQLVPGEPESTTVTSHSKKNKKRQKKKKNKKRKSGKNEARKVATLTSDNHNPIEISEHNKGPQRRCNSLVNAKEG